MSLPLWVEFFEDLQHVRGRSKNTVMAYRRDLEIYEDFKKENKEIPAFYSFLKKRNLSERSQARVISSLRTYFKFLESHDMETPELRQLKPPKVKQTLPKVLSAQDFQKLHEASQVEDSYKSARNSITLLMLFGLGCRVTELIDLNLEDFNETDAWVKIAGKGGKERVVPLTQRLLTELKTYLTEVRPNLVKDKTHSILVNDRGKRPSRVDVWRWLAAWSTKAGFENTVGPHQFRHGCATALLDSGADLRSIQMLLGHSSIQTTQIYTSVSSKRLKDAVDKHHILSDSEL